MQLALIFHVHAVIELDKIAVNDAGRGVKLRTRNLLHKMGYSAVALQLAGLSAVHLIPRLEPNGADGVDIGRQNRQHRFVDDIASTFEQVQSLHHQCTAMIFNQENARIITEYEPPSFIVREIGLRDKRNDFTAIFTLNDLELLLPAHQRDQFSGDNFTWPGK